MTKVSKQIQKCLWEQQWAKDRKWDELYVNDCPESTVTSHELTRFPAHNISLAVCREFGIHRHPLLISNACAAGNFAITAAYERIRKGMTQYAFAGGAELFSEVAFKGFSKLRSVASRKCSPFDKNREGMILGEGAGVLLLESLESAKKKKCGYLC